MWARNVTSITRVRARIDEAETMVPADRENENAVNLLIADVFRVLGAMDSVDPRDGREQLEPVVSRGWNALEELPRRRHVLNLSREDALLFDSALDRLRARLRFLVRVK